MKNKSRRSLELQSRTNRLQGRGKEVREFLETYTLLWPLALNFFSPVIACFDRPFRSYSTVSCT
jgi:hypothetical protein